MVMVTEEEHDDFVSAGAMYNSLFGDDYEPDFGEDHRHDTPVDGAYAADAASQHESEYSDGTENTGGEPSLAELASDFG